MRSNKWIMFFSFSAGLACAAVSANDPNSLAEAGVPSALTAAASKSPVAAPQQAIPTTEPTITTGAPAVPAIATGSTPALSNGTITKSLRNRKAFVTKSGADSDQPSALTQEQYRIDRLRKQDEGMGVSLSILEKQNRMRSLQDGGINAARGGPIRVLGIEGSSRALIATLRLASGEEIEVRGGDALPDGRRVSAVMATGISIGSGKSTIHVPVVLTSARSAPASTPQLPSERILVPMGGALPAPAALK
jgi:type IV pilus biogenesis protein PilP